MPLTDQVQQSLNPRLGLLDILGQHGFAIHDAGLETSLWVIDQNNCLELSLIYENNCKSVKLTQFQVDQLYIALRTWLGEHYR